MRGYGPPLNPDGRPWGARPARGGSTVGDHRPSAQPEFVRFMAVLGPLTEDTRALGEFLGALTAAEIRVLADRTGALHRAARARLA